MPALDPPAMRRVNAAVTLRAFAAAAEPLTMTHLVERTGLSRRTSHVILDDLTAEGWIEETEGPPGGAGVGRPPRRWRFRSDKALIVATRVDTFATHAVVADLSGRILSRTHAVLESHRVPEEVMASTVRVAQGALDALGASRDRVRAVTLSTGGTVDDDGRVMNLPEEPLWTGYDPRVPLARHFPCPVLVENDTNLAALAERWRGAAGDHDTFVWFLAGSRAGAGIVIRDRIHRGLRGYAGEVVHAEPLGLAALRGHPAARFSSPFPEERAVAVDLYERARAGDAAAVATVEEFVGPVVSVVVTLAWTIAPPLIVLPVNLPTPSGEYLLDRVSAGLVDRDAPPVELRLSTLGEDAFLLGGVKFALDRLDVDLFGPVPAG